MHKNGNSIQILIAEILADLATMLTVSSIMAFPYEYYVCVIIISMDVPSYVGVWGGRIEGGVGERGENVGLLLSDIINHSSSFIEVEIDIASVHMHS